MLTNSSTIAFVFLIISSRANDGIISSLISLVILVSTFSWTLEVAYSKKICNNYSKKCEHRNLTTLAELEHFVMDYTVVLYSSTIQWYYTVVLYSGTIQYLDSFTFHMWLC